MNLLKTVYRRCWSWSLVLAWWLAIEGTAWAAKATKSDKEESSAGNWVLSYFIVILAIALGMLVVCRTSRRSERAKPQKYEALKTSD